LERVLVCILAQTRAHQVAWPSFKRHVLDELSADLALAMTLNGTYDYVNPYWQHAKYKWTSFQPPDIGDNFDLAQRWLWNQRDVPPPDWRSMLRIKGIWQGGIQSPDPQRSFSANLIFCRWLLLHGLQQDGIFERYDRFVVTRSDFVWLCPHPPMSILDRESLWIPDGEHYGGLCDRHLIVSREDAIPALNHIDDILLRPDELYEESKHLEGMNDEVFLKHHLHRRGLLPRVKLFPYVMYSARRVRDPLSTWSKGTYYPSVGHKVKYVRELRSARAYATVIKTREDWERGEWRTFDAKLAADQFGLSRVDRLWSTGRKIASALRLAADQLGRSRVNRLWLTGRKIASALRRPGRIARLKRYLRRRRSKDAAPR
jgi:hypothetical protein